MTTNPDTSEIVTGDVLSSPPFEITAFAQHQPNGDWAYGVALRVQDDYDFPRAGTLRFFDTNCDSQKDAINKANDLLKRLDRRVKAFGYQGDEFTLSSLFGVIDVVMDEKPGD